METRAAVGGPQRAAFRRDGYVVLRGAVGGAALEELRAQADELARGGVARLEHHERSATDGARVMCRVEDFADTHEGLGAFCRGFASELAAQLMGGPVALFKEKINFKAPGGGGFAPHQDSVAYANLAKVHVTVMVALDAATEENGCLEFAPGKYAPGQLALLPSNVIEDAEVAALPWRHEPLAPGDVVCFDGYLPHRSGTNRTSAARRALLVTFNDAREGDHRARYYAVKRGTMRPGEISLNSDFLGQIVE